MRIEVELIGSAWTLVGASGAAEREGGGGGGGSEREIERASVTGSMGPGPLPINYRVV